MSLGVGPAFRLAVARAGLKAGTYTRSVESARRTWQTLFGGRHLVAMNDELGTEMLELLHIVALPAQRLGRIEKARQVLRLEVAPLVRGAVEQTDRGGPFDGPSAFDARFPFVACSNERVHQAAVARFADLFEAGLIAALALRPARARMDRAPAGDRGGLVRLGTGDDACASEGPHGINVALPRTSVRVIPRSGAC